MHKWAFPDGAFGNRDEKSCSTYQTSGKAQLQEYVLLENGDKSGLPWLKLFFPSLGEAVEHNSQARTVFCMDSVTCAETQSRSECVT